MLADAGIVAGRCCLGGGPGGDQANSGETARGALDLIEQHGCTAIYTLPAMTNALVAHPSFDRRRTATLRTGVTIGAPQDILKAAEQLGASDPGGKSVVSSTGARKS